MTAAGHTNEMFYAVERSGSWRGTVNSRCVMEHHLPHVREWLRLTEICPSPERSMSAIITITVAGAGASTPPASWGRHDVSSPGPRSVDPSHTCHRFRAWHCVCTTIESRRRISSSAHRASHIAPGVAPQPSLTSRRRQLYATNGCSCSNKRRWSLRKPHSRR